MKNIVLKELRWGNAFSYGDKNSLKLNESRLTQIKGVNGAGKTSIPMILTEITHGKNLRNITKEDISNWNTNNKGFWIELDFSSADSEYTIKLDRKSSLKLELIKDGEDISEHRSPDTYKKIDAIFGGLGYKAFLPLIYQSTQVALDFLRSTDKTRKTFLLSLLQQEKYTELYEHYRKYLSEAKKKLDNHEGKVEVHEDWLKEYANFNFQKQEPVETSDLTSEISDVQHELKSLEKELSSIKETNRKISKNNDIKKELESLDTTKSLKTWEKDNELAILEDKVSKCNSVLSELNAEDKMLEKTYGSLRKDLDTFGKGTCPTCGQDVENEHLEKELKLILQKREEISLDYDKYSMNLQDITDEVKDLKREKREIELHNQEVHKTEEKYNWLIKTLDSTLSDKFLDPDDFAYKIKDTKEKLTKLQKELKNCEVFNKKVEAHNSKIDYVSKQYSETEAKLEEELKEVDYWQDTVNTLTVIKEAFGNKGLITYKLESSIKHLESEINNYLRAVSDYQMYFFNEGDKLNIKVIDSQENEIKIDSFSTGELGRINIATLLGIRKMMSEISDIHINFLFLDEIVGVLDDEGRETLAETLLAEENLNTFMVAHGTEVHPLAEKVFVEKEGKISKLKYG